MTRATLTGPVRGLVATAAVLSVGASAGCEQRSALGAPEIEVSPTTPTAVGTWPAESAARTRLVVEGGDGRKLATEWQPAGSGEASARILGLSPSADWSVLLEVEDGATSSAVDFTTPGLPGEIPGWTISGTPAWDGWMVSAITSGNSWIIVSDAAGNIAWFGDGTTERLAVRTSLRNDGEGVYFGVEYLQTDEQDGEIVGLNWAGENDKTHPLPTFTHEFYERDDGSFVWVENDCRDMEGLGRVCGNRLMTGDPDGEAVELWNVFDVFNPAFDGELAMSGDWAHANALRVDEKANVAWLGFRGFDAILGIDLESGELLEQIGGPYSDWTYNALTKMTDQHQFQWLDDGTLLVHDNRTVELGSRIARYAFDESTGVAEIVEEFQHSPPVWDYILGDVNRSAEGDTLVTWSAAGVMENFDADNESVWTMELDMGQTFGYTTRVDELPGMIRLN